MTAAGIKACLEREIHAHPACRNARVQIDVQRPKSGTTVPWSIRVRALGARGPVDPEACEEAIRTIVARARSTS